MGGRVDGVQRIGNVILLICSHLPEREMKFLSLPQTDGVFQTLAAVQGFPGHLCAMKILGTNQGLLWCQLLEWVIAVQFFLGNSKEQGMMLMQRMTGRTHTIERVLIVQLYNFQVSFTRARIIQLLLQILLSLCFETLFLMVVVSFRFRSTTTYDMFRDPILSFFFFLGIWRKVVVVTEKGCRKETLFCIRPLVELLKFQQHIV